MAVDNGPWILESDRFKLKYRLNFARRSRTSYLTSFNLIFRICKIGITPLTLQLKDELRHNVPQVCPVNGAVRIVSRAGHLRSNQALKSPLPLSGPQSLPSFLPKTLIKKTSVY